MTTKVILTVQVPGAKLMSEKVCESDPKHNYEFHKLVITDQKDKRDVINFRTRKTETVNQVINMTDGAYAYMVSKKCPFWAKMGTWRQMSQQERLQAHMERTASYLGGTVLSYEVLPD